MLNIFLELYSSNSSYWKATLEKLFSHNKCIKIVIMYIPVLFKRTHKGDLLSPSLPLDLSNIPFVRIRMYFVDHSKDTSIWFTSTYLQSYFHYHRLIYNGINHDVRDAKSLCQQNKSVIHILLTAIV